MPGSRRVRRRWSRYLLGLALAAQGGCQAVYWPAGGPGLGSGTNHISADDTGLTDGTLIGPAGIDGPTGIGPDVVVVDALGDVGPMPGMASLAAADLNGDGRIDGADLAVFTSAFEAGAGEARYLPSLDFDGDGRVSLIDYQIWYGLVSETRP